MGHVTSNEAEQSGLSDTSDSVTNLENKIFSQEKILCSEFFGLC